MITLCSYVRAKQHSWHPSCYFQHFHQPRETWKSIWCKRASSERKNKHEPRHKLWIWLVQQSLQMSRIVSQANLLTHLFVCVFFKPQIQNKAFEYLVGNELRIMYIIMYLMGPWWDFLGKQLIIHLFKSSGHKAVWGSAWFIYYTF